MTRLYTNGASTTLATAVNNTDDPVTFDVALGTGNLFPAITGNDTFIVTLEDTAGTIERIEITARSTDRMTGNRAQDNTTISAFSIGDVCDLRIGASDMEQFAQQGQPLDLGGNELSNADAVASCTWTGGAMRAGTYFAADGGTANVLQIPDGGGPPTINNDRILTASDLGSSSPELDALYNTIYPVGIVILMNELTAPPTANAPAGTTWVQLTGAYNRYLRFSSTPQVQYSVLNQATEEGGAHQHGDDGRTLEHTLTLDELPSHRHGIGGNSDRFYVRGATGGGWPTGSPAEVGTTAAPTLTNFAGGNEGHSHGITQHDGHTHDFPNPEPNGYTLVPWLRTN